MRLPDETTNYEISLQLMCVWEHIVLNMSSLS